MSQFSTIDVTTTLGRATFCKAGWNLCKSEGITFQQLSQDTGINYETMRRVATEAGSHNTVEAFLQAIKDGTRLGIVSYDDVVREGNKYPDITLPLAKAAIKEKARQKRVPLTEVESLRRKMFPPVLDKNGYPIKQANFEPEYQLAKALEYPSLGELIIAPAVNAAEVEAKLVKAIRVLEYERNLTCKIVSNNLPVSANRYHQLRNRGHFSDRVREALPTAFNEPSEQAIVDEANRLSAIRDTLTPERRVLLGNAARNFRNRKGVSSANFASNTKLPSEYIYSELEHGRMCPLSIVEKVIASAGYSNGLDDLNAFIERGLSYGSSHATQATQRASTNLGASL